MSKWRRFLTQLSGGRASWTISDAQVCFTGRLPSNKAEQLINKLAGERSSVPLSWLQRRICEELYQQDLRQGGWVTDLGILGPEGFAREAAEMLAAMRPEFGGVTLLPSAGDTPNVRHAG